VTIGGSNFGSTQGASTVSFNGTSATPTTWSASSIVTPVPSGATTGNVVVHASGVNSNGVSFTVVPAPSITSLSPSSGPVGASLTISGANFGSTQGSSTVTFNGTLATVTSWSSTSIVASVPSGATTGAVVVHASGVNSNGVSFAVLPRPNISGLSPTSGAVGTSVTITGTNFGSTQGTSTVTFNGTSATATSWSATSIVATVPSGASTGNVVVTVSGQASSGVSFTVAIGPTITSLSATTASIGFTVKITGSGFGSTQGTSTVRFNGTPGTAISWSDTSIVATVPSGASTGNVVVNAVGVDSNGLNLIIPAPDTSFVQGNSASFQTPQTTVTVPYSAAQTQGNLNIVEINYGYSSPSQVQSVTDSAGNNYAQASATSVSGLGAQEIYYAANINSSAAGANTVTVNFSAVTAADVSVAEYSGVDTSSPLDVAASNQGNSTRADSGSVSPATANDLLIGTALVQPGTSITGGNGYTPAVITTPDVNVLEDQLVIAFGNYSATATLSAAGQWIMQLAAFRTLASSNDPRISSLSPSAAAAGTIAITGANFGSTQGTSTVTFNGAALAPNSWSASSIVVPIPTSIGTGNVVVTVNGTSSNGSPFTVLSSPNISSMTPTTGGPGTPITITGSNFGANRGSDPNSFDTVIFNGSYYAAILNWSDTQISAFVPQGVTTGTMTVTVFANGASSNGANFTVTNASNISSLSPNIGNTGQSVTISGIGFGATQQTSTVSFNGVTASPTSWSDTAIQVPVPAGASSGSVYVTVSGVPSNGVPFTVLPAITNVVPASAAPGASVTIVGHDFRTTEPSGSSVTFNGTPASVASWGPNGIVVSVPSTATTGQVIVNVGGTDTDGYAFTVLSVPTITSVSPNSGITGTQVTVSGSGFGSVQGSGSLLLGSTYGVVTSWSDTQVVANIASGAKSGNAQIVQAGVSSNAVPFTVIAPVVSGASPSSGIAGTTVTISGSGFGATQGNGNVWLGSTYGIISSWGDTQIVAAIASSAQSGTVKILQNRTWSNALPFTVSSPPPSITLSPSMMNMLVGQTHY